MRIAIMSDLHLEHDVDLVRRAMAQASRGTTGGLPIHWWRHLNARQSEPGHPLYGPDLMSVRGADLMILAGDIWHGTQGIAYADDVAKYLGCQIVIIAGNHDHYGSDMTLTIPQMISAAQATEGRVIFLDDSRADFVIDGRHVAVLGSTLFTDYRLNGDDRQLESMMSAAVGLNDHRCIALDGNYFTPGRALEMHERSRAWLAEAVPRAKDDSDIVIVLVHHGVVPEANAPEHRGGSLAPAFASDLTEDIREWCCDLVAAGHTHHPLDMMIGKTRIVSAPRGYVGTETGVENYVPLIVEL